MSVRNIISVVLVIFAVATGIYIFAGGQGTDGEVEQTEAEAAAAPAEDTGHRVVAWYFHTTVRCPTCIKIEKYTRESIEENFAPQLESGVLELRVVNVEEPENSHFIEDYQLTTKSVVISDFVDGEEVAWKNLEKVWEYTGDRGVFVDYIRDETAEYLAELGRQ